MYNNKYKYIDNIIGEGYTKHGEKGKDTMKKKIKYPDKPVGKLTRVKDFLPPPVELAKAEKTQKITIALKKSSIQFFKREANRHHTKYQRMIRDLVDKYVMQYL